MTALYCPYFIESLIKTNQQTFYVRVCSIRKRSKETFTIWQMKCKKL